MDFKIGYPMSNLADLIAQRTALEQKINEISQTQRTEAIEKIRAMMEENGLKLSDLSLKAKNASKAKSTTKNPVAAKYRDPAGNQWSGRGLQPRWLKAALAEGKPLSDFAV